MKISRIVDKQYSTDKLREELDKEISTEKLRLMLDNYIDIDISGKLIKNSRVVGILALFLGIFLLVIFLNITTFTEISITLVFICILFEVILILSGVMLIFFPKAFVKISKILDKQYSADKLREELDKEISTEKLRILLDNISISMTSSINIQDL